MVLQVIRTIRHMAGVSQAIRRRGETIGFVPTMGALHEGHASLIRAARRECDQVVVSIFVNPLQFGPREDYARYPRTFKEDLKLAEGAGASLVFAPQAAEMYPTGFRTHVAVEGLSEVFEGKIRPGHFRGVTTVVLKLFSIIQPTVAWFGQKDYQQAVLIQRMVDDLGLPVTVRVLPTVREPDGLARSSRNRYLTPPQRRQAPALYQALQEARTLIQQGERRAARLTAAMKRVIAKQPSLRVEYLAVVDAATLEPLATLRGSVALLVAARLGTTRLIDNLLVDVS